MDDGIPGKESPQRNDKEAMEAMEAVLPSAAERRAFQRFCDGLAHRANGVSEQKALDIWRREYADTWRQRRQITAAQMQAEEIRKHRWIESEKHRCDIGKAAALDWIKHHAEDWRRWFENHYDGPLEECE
jgi:hypothetical protein